MQCALQNACFIAEPGGLKEIGVVGVMGVGRVENVV